MRTSWRARIAAALVASAALVFFCGRPIVERVGIFLAVDGFRDHHNTEGYPAPVLSSFDWAMSFGGEDGLAAFEQLAHDASISAAGRTEAALIKRLIESGRFEEELRWNEEHGISPGLYHRWLLRR